MKHEHTYSTAIIGAGPAGLIAAYYLRDKDTLVIEKGATLNKRVCPMTTICKDCSRCGEIEGVGGAGGWSDGKLCLGPVGILDTFLGENYSQEVDSVLTLFKQVLGNNYVEPYDLIDKNFIKGDLYQEITPVVNLGTSTIRLAFQLMYDAVLESGCKFLTNEKVTDITGQDNFYKIETKSGKNILARNLIVATGKCDFNIVPGLIKTFNLETIKVDPTLGFRLSIPNDELLSMKALGSNPKLKLRLPNGDSIKTHCFCYGGEVMAYLCGDFFLVGGRADYRNPSAFSNVNVLYKFSSLSAYAQTTVRDILYNIKQDYPLNIIYQDLLSFLEPDRSPTMTEVPLCRGAKLGSLLPYYPETITHALREFVYVMAETYGMNIARASIFGPACEWINDAVSTSLTMETKKGLYIVGDGAGMTQGIMSAAVTGYRAARSIQHYLETR